MFTCLHLRKGILREIYKMSNINIEDLMEIKLDLDGMVSLLTVIESSEYYQNTSDDGVMRALRNSIELTRNKLIAIMGDEDCEK